MISVTVNGEKKTFSNSLTVHEFLEQLKIGFQSMAISINNTVIPRSQLMEQIICDGDQIEIIRPIGGG